MQSNNFNPIHYKPTLIVMALAAIITACIAAILDRIGFTITLFFLIYAIPLTAAIYASLAYRTASYREFIRIGSNTPYTLAAMAATAELLSLFMIIGLAGALRQTAYDGISIILGFLLGIILMATLILRPRVDENPIPTSPVQALYPRPKGKFGRLVHTIIALIFAVSCLTFFAGQVKIAGEILELFLPLDGYWPQIILVAPILMLVLAGGMRSISLTNMFFYLLIIVAIIFPATWLSAKLGGSIFAPATYGYYAIDPMLELQRSVSNGQISAQTILDTYGNFAQQGRYGGLILSLLGIGMGISVLPTLFWRVRLHTEATTRIRTLGWTSIWIGLFFMVLPALVAFSEAEIFTDLVGLKVSQLQNTAYWLFDWADRGDGQHALICGATANSMDAIVAACGSAEHIIIPSDIEFSSIMMVMGLGSIADLPIFFSALAMAGVVAAALSTGGIALAVFGPILVEDIIGNRSNTKTDNVNDAPLAANLPNARKLVIARIGIILAAVGGSWLAIHAIPPSFEPSLWALSLLGGAVFMPVIFANNVQNVSIYTLGAGVMVGTITMLILFFGIELGPDLTPSSGDEWAITYPLIDEPIRDINAGFAGAVSSLATMVIFTMIQRLVMTKSGESGSGLNDNI